MSRFNLGLTSSDPSAEGAEESINLSTFVHFFGIRDCRALTAIHSTFGILPDYVALLSRVVKHESMTIMAVSNCDL